MIDTIKNSYKNLFNFKQDHIAILLIAFVWTLIFAFTNEKNETSNALNLIGFILNFVFSLLSIQFLQNIMHSNTQKNVELFGTIKFNLIGSLIKLDIIWGTYAFLAIFLSTLIFFYNNYIAILLYAIIAFLTPFVNFIYLRLADQDNAKGLWNIFDLFKFIKPTLKELYKKLIMFILLTLIAMLIYVLIYVITGIIGIDKIGYISEDYYILDIIMETIAIYFSIITWYFAFPYSLIEIYKNYTNTLAEKV